MKFGLVKKKGEGFLWYGPPLLEVGNIVRWVKELFGGKYNKSEIVPVCPVCSEPVPYKKMANHFRQEHNLKTDDVVNLMVDQFYLLESLKPKPEPLRLDANVQEKKPKKWGR